MRPEHEGIRPGRRAWQVGRARAAAGATYPDGAVLGRRVLDDHELVWILRGAARIAVGDAAVPHGPLPGTLHLAPGQVLLLPPGVPHEFAWSGPGGVLHGFVHAEVSGLPPGLAPRVVTTSPDDPLEGLCRYLLWLGARRPAGWQERTRATVASLLDLVLTGPLPSWAPAETWPPLIDAVLLELRERWGGGPPLPPVRVHDLAEAVHVSPTHLNRAVRRSLGRPVSTLLEQLRLTRVEGLLTGTSATLEAVARACAFADAFHCSRRFSRAHGIPPSVYRRTRPGTTLLDDPVVRRAAATVWRW